MVNIIFYICVLGLTMFQMQVGLVFVSLISAMIYHFYLKKSSGRKYFLMVIVLFVISALLNPLFSHKGATLLFYLPTGNPVTAESIIYGTVSAMVICSALLWFSSMNTVITQDKLIEIAGRSLPHFALLLSMIFRVIPLFAKQVKKVYFTQQALGVTTKGFKNKIKLGIRVFSITTTWALENSVDTADSMKSRGYGSGKRTTYHKYQFEIRDIVTMIWILAATIYIAIRLFLGNTYTYYYPFFETKEDVTVYGIYLLLCMTPMIINGREAFRWHRLKSKI